MGKLILWSDEFEGTPPEFDNIEVAQMFASPQYSGSGGFDIITVLDTAGHIYMYSTETMSLLSLEVEAPNWVGGTFKFVTDGVAINTDDEVIIGRTSAYTAPIPPGTTAAKIAACDCGGTVIVMAADGAATMYAYNTDSPLYVYFPTGLYFQHVSLRSYIGVAVKTDGSIISFGYQSLVQDLGPPPAVTNAVMAEVVDGIFAGDHAIALLDDGSVACWGDNSRGQCDAPMGITAVSVSAGDGYSTAVLDDGSVVMWGLEEPVD